MIEAGKKVSIEYTLKLDDGTVADSNVGGDPLTYEHGQGQILPALEEALSGMAKEETKQVVLNAEQGYGAVDPEAFRDVSPESIPEDARKEGTMLVAQDESGNQQQVRVHEVNEEKIVIDFNHPLAGQNLNFDIKVLTVE